MLNADNYGSDTNSSNSNHDSRYRKPLFCCLKPWNSQLHPCTCRSRSRGFPELHCYRSSIFYLLDLSEPSGLHVSIPEKLWYTPQEADAVTVEPPSSAFCAFCQRRILRCVNDLDALPSMIGFSHGFAARMFCYGSFLPVLYASSACFATVAISLWKVHMHAWSLIYL
jgi:hypothetical protein